MKSKFSTLGAVSALIAGLGLATEAQADFDPGVASANQIGYWAFDTPPDDPVPNLATAGTVGDCDLEGGATYEGGTNIAPVPFNVDAMTVDGDVAGQQYCTFPFSAETDFRGAGDEFTFAAWVYSTDLTHQNSIWQQEDDGGTGRTLLMIRESGQVSTFIGGAFNDAGGDAVTENTWVHVAITYDEDADPDANEAQIKLYVNGVLRNTVDNINFIGENAAGDYRIGAHKSNNDIDFEGEIDEARLFDAALTDEEIAALYAGSIAGEELYLVDTVEPDDGISILYSVDLQEGPSKAVLTPLDTEECASGTAAEGTDGAVPYNHVDILAGTPDGMYLYFVNDGPIDAADELVQFNIATGECTQIAALSGSITAVANTNDTDQGAFSPNGTLYIGENATETIHTVNLGTAVTSFVGTLAVIDAEDDCTALDLQGSDWTFDNAGNLYIFTNNGVLGGAGLPDAPRGLYIVAQADLATPTTCNDIGGAIVEASLIADNPVPNNFTGWANRLNGLGNVVGSSNDDPGDEDEMIELDTVNIGDGQLDQAFDMVDEAMDPFDHIFGDMSNGRQELCGARTVGYYKNRISGRVDESLNGEDVELCGFTLLADDAIDNIMENRRGNEYSQLAAQLIAAIWNCDRAEDGEINGDCNRAGVPTISEAENFLCNESDIAGDILSAATLETAVFEKVDKDDKAEVGDHVSALDAYNNQGHDSALCEMFEPEDDGYGPPPI